MSKTPPRGLAEEALERAITLLDGPLNRALERTMKSRLVLAPLGLTLSACARGAVALRRRDPRVLWRGVTSRVGGER